MTGEREIPPALPARPDRDAGIDGATQAFLTALGRIVRLERLQGELTQQQLANRAGMSRSFISLIEHGSHGVDIVRLLRLAAVLGRPLSSIITDAERRAAAGVQSLSELAPGGSR